MYIAHYILPFIAVFIYLVIYKKENFNKKAQIGNFIKKQKNKIILTSAGMILFGLLLGNLVDLDHVYYRIIGKVPWLSSACGPFGEQCSFLIYPLHSFTFMFSFLALAGLIFSKSNKIKFFGWLFFGAFLNLFLDLIQLKTGFGF